VTKLSVRVPRCFLCFIISSDRCSAKPRHRSTVPCSSSCYQHIITIHLHQSLQWHN